MLFLGWNAPNHYPPWTTFHLELFSALGLCLLCAAVFFGVRLPQQPHGHAAGRALPAERVRIPLPLSARAWLLLALLPMLQLLAGGLVFRGDAWLGLLYGLGMVLGLYVGLLWAAQQGRAQVLRVLCITVVLGGIAACGLALVQWLRLSTPGWWTMELIDDRPYASFAQPNHLGLLMVMAVVAVTALFETRAVLHRWVWVMAVGFFGWGMLMSQSRSAALALAAVALLWALTRKRAPTRLRWSDLLIGVLVGLLLSALVDPLQQLLLLKGTEFRASADAGPRQWIWLHFWAAILERPWAGYGFNQGVAALAEVAGQVHPSRNVVFAHNVVLDLMTWVGIPLALVICGALAFWMLGWLRRDPDSTLMAQRHWVFAIWLALALQSMLEFPYTHSYFLLPAALLAGAVMPLPMRRPHPDVKPLYVASHWVKALAAGAALLLGLLSWEYLQLEEDFRHNRFARANFTNLPVHESLSEPLVLDQLAALNASANIKIAPGMSADELQQLHVLARRFHILSTRLDYAKALALNGRMADAQHELQVIRSVLHPTRYQGIEQNWLVWLKANGTVIEAPSRVRGPGSGVRS
ncbi:MAG: O-antigen ligase C-terminal domain-containing protein [Rubrivivax sp.]|nr:O-antigen ligase C-terminal domain-containing protein [Rubrivivax sp.]